MRPPGEHGKFANRKFDMLRDMFIDIAMMSGTVINDIAADGDKNMCPLSTPIIFNLISLLIPVDISYYLMISVNHITIDVHTHTIHVCHIW